MLVTELVLTFYCHAVQQTYLILQYTFSITFIYDKVGPPAAMDSYQFCYHRKLIPVYLPRGSTVSSGQSGSTIFGNLDVHLE